MDRVPAKPPLEPLPRPSRLKLDRSKADQTEWAAVKQRMAHMLPTAQGKLSNRLSKLFARIDRDFAFSAEPGDDQFVYLHVEPLLDQAADLLDRGLRDRSTHDDLSAAFFSTMLDISEYADLDAIHVAEETAGIYLVPAQQSAASREAEGFDGQSARVSFEKLSDLRRDFYNIDYLKEQNRQAQIGGCMGLVVSYTWKGQEFAGYTDQSFDGVTRKTYQWGQLAAATMSAFSIMNQNYTTLVQSEVARNAVNASARRFAGIDAKAKWDALNVDFQKRRTLAARKAQDLKAKAATDPDGVLNFSRRILPLRKRFAADFRNAIARINATAVGLQKVYGYAVPLPANPQSSDYFDDMLVWVRDAIHWLVRFARVEQNLVYPLSVRDTVGEASWLAGLAARKWQVEIPSGFLPGAAHVRLRGLSAVAVAPEGLWAISARAPRDAVTHHLSGADVALSQSMVPAVRLHRVTMRDAVRDPDVLGVSALFNASPVGTWEVELISVIPASASPDSLHDIQLDLHLAYRAMPVRP